MQLGGGAELRGAAAAERGSPGDLLAAPAEDTTRPPHPSQICSAETFGYFRRFQVRGNPGFGGGVLVFFSTRTWGIDVPSKSEDSTLNPGTLGQHYQGSTF